jgi:hypothetical protein
MRWEKRNLHYNYIKDFYMRGVHNSSWLESTEIVLLVREEDERVVPPSLIIQETYHWRIGG